MRCWQEILYVEGLKFTLEVHIISLAETFEQNFSDHIYIKYSWASHYHWRIKLQVLRIYLSEKL